MEKELTLVSTFTNIYLKDYPQNHTVIEVLEGIKSKSNPFQQVIKDIRTTDHKTANLLKGSLTPICFSGIFTTQRDSDLVKYSQLICIDVDDVTDLRVFRKEVMDIPYVYSAFISPSGKGLKILVFHNCSNPVYHSRIYYKIGEELGLTTRTDLKFDTHCSNISRACYFSYDPDLKINRNADILSIDINTLPPISKVKHSKPHSGHDEINVDPILPLPSDYKGIKRLKTRLVNDLTQFERFYSFYPGVRNKNLNILVFTLRKKGYPKELVMAYLSLYYGSQQLDFTFSEIERIVSSVYNNL